MDLTTEKERLSGWGRYPWSVSAVGRPAAVAKIAPLLASAEQGLIARGCGRSYGDSALCAGGCVVNMERLDHFIAFDPGTGVVTAEAGVTLRGLIEVVLPHGWFLPTTPGTQLVTLGGTIAADVHGKNHHVDGSFGTWVRGIDLLLADGRVVSIGPGQDAELFWATVGGMGLTGIILRATLQLRRAETAYYRARFLKTGSLDETLEQLAATAADYRYSVGWIDCLGGKRQRGRSVLMLANEAGMADLPARLRQAPLQVSTPRMKRVPVDFPGWALNCWSVRAFNTLYYHSNRAGERIIDYRRYFYPLDAVADWNRIYGRRGFIQYQALFPLATARAGLQQLLAVLDQFGLASFLAVIKRCGPSNPAPLSYLHEGVTLALDIPQAGERLREMVRRLDAILLDHGGRLYLAKDALMSAETFARMYPRRDEFLAVKARVDPQRRFWSDQAQRVFGKYVG